MWDNFFGTSVHVYWSQKVLDFYHFGEILDLFCGANLLFVTTVHTQKGDGGNNLISEG